MRQIDKIFFDWFWWFLVITLIGGKYDSNLLENLKGSLESESLEDVEKNNDNSTQKIETSKVDGNLIVDFIDVGQGDSILIRQGDHAMLIDGGTSECKDDLLNFLKSENIQKFDYIVGTHPHEDHIGSLDDVINAYDFDTILFPKVTTTTKTFENFHNCNYKFDYFSKGNYAYYNGLNFKLNLYYGMCLICLKNKCVNIYEDDCKCFCTWLRVCVAFGYFSPCIVSYLIEKPFSFCSLI